MGGGVLIPTTANDLYFAELGLWLGVSPSELTTVFPNLLIFIHPDPRHLWAFLTFNSIRDEILLYFLPFPSFFVIAAQSQCYMDQHSTNWNDGWLSCKRAFHQPNPR